MAPRRRHIVSLGRRPEAGFVVVAVARQPSAHLPSRAQIAAPVSEAAIVPGRHGPFRPGVHHDGRGAGRVIARVMVVETPPSSTTRAIEAKRESGRAAAMRGTGLVPRKAQLGAQVDGPTARFPIYL